MSISPLLPILYACENLEQKRVVSDLRNRGFCVICGRSFSSVASSLSYIHWEIRGMKLPQKTDNTPLIEAAMSNFWAELQSVKCVKIPAVNKVNNTGLNALQTHLVSTFTKSLFGRLCKAILSIFSTNKSKMQVVYETNKARSRNLMPNRFLPSSVGRSLESWSGGLGCKPHWVQFLTKFILFCETLDLSNNLTEMLFVKKFECYIMVWKLFVAFEGSELFNHERKGEINPMTSKTVTIDLQ